MKYIVTGGAGFIGSHLVDELIKRGHEVIVIDNLSTGKKEQVNAKAQLYEADITDYRKIQSLFKGIDGVFHLAAIPSVSLSMTDPVGTAEVNIGGTMAVFQAAVDGGAKKIVFASSAAIYGNAVGAVTENMQPDPISPYGFQKWIGEQAASFFSTRHGIPIISLRYFNVYGPRMNAESDYSSVVSAFISQKAMKKPFTIFGTGEQSRGFCYVDDVVEATISAMVNDAVIGACIMNISSKESYTINQLAELLGGEKIHATERVGDIMHSIGDISKAEELLGWCPKVNAAEGIQKTLASYEK